MIRRMCVALLFFGLLAVATVLSGQYTLLKGALLAGLLLSLSPRSINISEISLLGLVIILVVGLYSTLAGLQRWPVAGALDDLRNYFFWPAVMWVLFSFKYEIEYVAVIKKIFNFFIMAAPVAVVLIVVLSLLSGERSWALPGDSAVSVFAIGINEGRLDLAFLGINFFMFAAYFHTARLFMHGYRVTMVSVGVGLLYAALLFIVGRRIFLVGYFVLLAALFFYRVRSPKVISVGAVSLILAFFTSVYLFDLNMSAIIDDLAEGFSVASVGGFERVSQHGALMAMFYERPLFGHGFGSVAFDVIRNHDKPWSYELSFHKVLVNSGVVGLSSYLVTFVSFCLVAVKRVPGLRPFIFALAVYSGGAVSNPYLANVDMLWVFGVLVWASFPANIPIDARVLSAARIDRSPWSCAGNPAISGGAEK